MPYNEWASPADRRGSRRAAGLPFVSWTKLPCLRPLEGLQAAGSLPNRRRCWGSGLLRLLTDLPPSQQPVSRGWASLAEDNEPGRRLFPSRSLVACVAFASLVQCPGRRGLLRGGNGVRGGVPENPNCSAAAAARGTKKSCRTAHLCRIGGACAKIHHIPAAEERWAQITIAAAREWSGSRTSSCA